MNSLFVWESALFQAFQLYELAYSSLEFRHGSSQERQEQLKQHWQHDEHPGVPEEKEAAAFRVGLGFCPIRTKESVQLHPARLQRGGGQARPTDQPGEEARLAVGQAAVPEGMERLHCHGQNGDAAV